MSFARRLVLVASDHRYGQHVQTHVHKTFLLTAPVVRFEDLPELMTAETDGLVLFLAANADDHERIESLMRSIRIQQFPVKTAILQTEEFASIRRFDSARTPIESCWVWPEQLRDLNTWIRRTLTEGPPFTDLANESSSSRIRRRLCEWTPSLEPFAEQLQIAAAHDVTVLIQGETGTGKSHLARLIHDCSDRRTERCLVVACGAFSGNLLASEIFGHVGGAYAGADSNKVGKFAAAGRGTVLLDEIETLGLDLQANLLRVIESGEFEPVGSNETHHCQARIIASTNANLAEAVERGTFRRDLYYRLQVIAFHLPPLRERPRDLGPLLRGMVARFAARYGKKIDSIHPDFVHAIEAYAWPGNIRQLDHVIQQAVLTCPGEELMAAHLSPSVRLNPIALTEAATIANGNSLAQNRESTEKAVIVRALEKASFSRTRAAQLLGVSRVTLYKKMKKYGLLSKATPILAGAMELPLTRS